jgi:hypothetical protein
MTGVQLSVLKRYIHDYPIAKYLKERVARNKTGTKYTRETVIFIFLIRIMTRFVLGYYLFS